MSETLRGGAQRERWACGFFLAADETAAAQSIMARSQPENVGGGCGVEHGVRRRAEAETRQRV